MPPPGLTVDQCRCALLQLLRTARALAVGEFATDLADLAVQLEQELVIRATVEGQSRMSTAEALVFEPTIRRLRILLQSSRGGSMTPAEIAAAISAIAEAGLVKLDRLTIH